MVYRIPDALDACIARVLVNCYTGFLILWPMASLVHCFPDQQSPWCTGSWGRKSLVQRWIACMLLHNEPVFNIIAV